MRKLQRGYSVGLLSGALFAGTLITAGATGGCGSSGSPSGWTGGGDGVMGSGASSGGQGGAGTGAAGSSAGYGGASGGGGSTGSGATSGAGGTSGSGGSTTGAGGSMTGTGGTTGGDGGAGTGSGGADSGAGSGGGTPTTTPDLIGPGGATCGNPNATHDDGWMCILSYPSGGTNAVGAWFDYAWAGGTCTYKLTKPSGTTRQICFSGGNCTGTAPGAGLGLSVCDIHGVNVSTWPQMESLITSHGLSTSGKSTFSQCNTGAKMTSLTWTVGSGSIPAGMSVLFDDAADQVLGRVDNLAAGATSVTVPATVDTSKIASIQFAMNGATIKSWDFCLSSFKIAYQ